MLCKTIKSYSESLEFSRQFLSSSSSSSRRAVIMVYLNSLSLSLSFSQSLSFSFSLFLSLSLSHSLFIFLLLFRHSYTSSIALDKYCRRYPDKVSKVSDRSQGWPKGYLFKSSTSRCRGGHYSFPFTLPLIHTL